MKPMLVNLAVLGAVLLFAPGLAATGAVAAPCAKNVINAGFLGSHPPASHKWCADYDAYKTFAHNLRIVGMFVNSRQPGSCTWYFKDSGGWTKIGTVAGGRNDTYTFNSRPPHHRTILVNC